jgi:alanine dehydrogenase
MIIGSVKEIKKLEFRIGLTPNACHAYIQQGHEVWIEKGAGVGSGFMDEDYLEKGALIKSVEEIWNQADMIVKVKEPLEEEYKYFRPGLILYTYLHLADNKPLFEALIKNKVKAIGYETMEKDGELPCLRPMSEIAGRLSVLEGAKYLEKPFEGRGVLISGIPGTPRAEVVIIGAGIVGYNACKMAVGLEANVTVLNRSVEKLTEFDREFGSKITTLISTPANIERSLEYADLVIGAVLNKGDKAPILIKDEYVKNMKEGSVIVDVAIDQGGISNYAKATYHDEPIYKVEGVSFYSVANMPGSVPRTASVALNNSTLQYGLEIANKGLEVAIVENDTIKTGLQTYNGVSTYDVLTDLFQTA